MHCSNSTNLVPTVAVAAVAAVQRSAGARAQNSLQLCWCDSCWSASILVRQLNSVSSRNCPLEPFPIQKQAEQLEIYAEDSFATFSLGDNSTHVPLVTVERLVSVVGSIDSRLRGTSLARVSDYFAPSANSCESFVLASKVTEQVVRNMEHSLTRHALESAIVSNRDKIGAQLFG